MRTQTKYIRIAVTKAVHERLREDRKHFQETIDGGKWSFSDTVREYQKMVNKKS